MPTKNIFKKALLAVLILVAVIISFKYALAVSCESIKDLDDRAKCYENKIENKQEEYESISKQLANIRSKKDNIAATITKYQSQLNVTQAEINDLQDQMDEVQNQLTIIEENLTDRKGKLSEKIDFRNKVVRNFAKRNITNDLETLFTSNHMDSNLNGIQYITYGYAFEKALSTEAIKLIHVLSSEIDTFESDKKEASELQSDLENSKANLLALKNDLSNKKADAQDNLGDLSSQQKDKENTLFDLEKEIADLSSKQQAILNQKSGNQNGSVGDYEAPKATTPNPPFSPAFAAFSYGAYTHYKGMSQYGANGRAKAGQDYKEILKFYYKSGVATKSMSTICVQGYGNMDFQKYLYGIAEMPSNWESEALKAQAIAARSYAYRYSSQGKCICTTQSCQVFSKSKSDNPPSSWANAVKDTKGVILSSDVTAYYSSTTGGYIDNIGWDGKWPDSSYEKKAQSPWFRKAWYTKSYNDTGNCGRAHPWLTATEMADIANAWKVWTKGSSSEKGHISPVTTSCWGGDPYSLDEMRQISGKYGGGYNKVSSIEATIGNNGQTSSVKIVTDKGTVTIDGQTFKTVFNLRAPSYLSLKSRLFDFEKK